MPPLDNPLPEMRAQPPTIVRARHAPLNREALAPMPLRQEKAKMLLLVRIGRRVLNRERAHKPQVERNRHDPKLKPGRPIGHRPRPIGHRRLLLRIGHNLLLVSGHGTSRRIMRRRGMSRRTKRQAGPRRLTKPLRATRRRPSHRALRVRATLLPRHEPRHPHIKVLQDRSQRRDHSQHPGRKLRDKLPPHINRRQPGNPLRRIRQRPSIAPSTRNRRRVTKRKGLEDENRVGPENTGDRRAARKLHRASKNEALA